MIFSVDKNYLASAGRDSSIHLYDVSSLSPENIHKRVRSSHFPPHYSRGNFSYLEGEQEYCMQSDCCHGRSSG